MIRTITGFHTDADGDWVAELSCWHNQHMRHRPPFQDRAWVLDETGRNDRIGTPIECVLCDRAEMPDGLVEQRRLGPWTRDAVPGGLQRDHRTPDGLWGLLRVLDGEVGFELDSLPVRQIGAGDAQAIPPNVAHRVVLGGPTRLELQLWGPA